MDKIVVCGSPLVGKRTLIAGLAKESGIRTERFEVRDAKHQARHIAIRLSLEDLVLETISGNVMHPSAWLTLLETASAAIMMLDAQDTVMDANQKHLGDLAEALTPKPGCIVVSKRDLSRVTKCSWLDVTPLTPPYAAWPRFTNSPADVLKALAELRHALRPA